VRRHPDSARCREPAHDALARVRIGAPERPKTRIAVGFACAPGRSYLGPCRLDAPDAGGRDGRAAPATGLAAATPWDWALTVASGFDLATGATAAGSGALP